MRLTFSICLFCVLQSFAIGSFSQNLRLSINQKNISIENVLQLIEDQTDYYFMYSTLTVDVKRVVDLEVTNKLVSEILDDIFKNTNVSYKINGRLIALSNNDDTFTVAQQKTITGKVTDSSSAPLPGVSVVVKGTTSGTITDFDGQYTLPNVPGDATLVFSFVGMKSQGIKVVGKSTINVMLEEDAIGIEEVVAVGYGTQKKIVTTGSIVSTKGVDLIKSPSPNLASSLTGRLPGVIINNSSGEPGYDDPTIYIRGRSTTGNANPLIIIDGVERSGLSRLNPSDIDNVTVLKDASAAIYGARAANGVILVTTKRGTSGKPQFEVTFNQGFTQPTRSLKMADSYTFGSVLNTFRAKQGLSARYTDVELQKFKEGSDKENYPNTNWQDMMIKNLTLTQRANIALSGGNERFKYMVSLGGLNQPGQFEHGTQTYQQYNLRSNIDVQVTNYFKFGFDLSGRVEDRHHPYSTTSIYSHLMLYLPTWTLYWPGTEYLYPCRDGQNIINMVSDNMGYTNELYKGVTSTLSFKLDIPWVKGLWLDGSANYDAGYNFNKTFYIPTYVYQKDNSTGAYARTLIGTSTSNLSEVFNHSMAKTVNTKINFRNSFKKHNVEAMLGYEQQQTSYDFLSAYRNNFISSALPELFAGSSVKSDQGNDGSSLETARQNFFGRVVYDYAGKYMAQAIFRYDGSQNFAKDKRYGFFPGFSVGWRVSEESFMKQLSFINNLKIRASYGELGNDQVSAFQYLSSYSYNSNYGYVIGGNDISGLTQSNVPNPNITWEVAKTSNIGLESNLWNGLLGLELDIFKTRRSNILTTRNAVVPDYTGLSLPSENIGIVENEGFEIQASHVNNRHAVKYNLSGNFSFARNKVIFSDEQPAAEPYQFATGRPMGAALYYNAIGIFNDQEEINNMPHLVGAQPGDIIFDDTNDDGSINSLDQIRINETNVPEIVYGLSASLKYKNFDLSVLLQGQENAKIYSAWLGRLNTNVGNFFQRRAQDFWTAENVTATMPRVDYGGNNNLTASTKWLFDAGFLRLKNLELGYNLPQNITGKMKIQALRLYINGFNLFYIYDHLKDWGMDPEANNTTWYYSQQRMFNVGFNLTF